MTKRIDVREWVDELTNDGHYSITFGSGNESIEFDTLGSEAFDFEEAGDTKFQVYMRDIDNLILALQEMKKILNQNA